jgi:hypothetical protein
LYYLPLFFFSLRIRLNLARIANTYLIVWIALAGMADDYPSLFRKFKRVENDW